MDTIEKFIKNYQRNHIVIQLYKSGLNPGEVENFLIGKIEKFFENTKNLKNLLYGPISPQINMFINIIEDKNYRFLFKELLDLYKQAFKRDKHKCITIINSWHKEIYRATSQGIIDTNLFQENKDVDLEEFSRIAFDLIGSMIEVGYKGYLLEIYQLVRLNNNEFQSKESIKKESLGNIIQYLISKNILIEVCRPSPWQVTLNQWRNIAQHYSYTISENEIQCKYGKIPNQKSLNVSGSDLQNFYTDLENFQSIFNLSYSIFYLDFIYDKEKEVVTLRSPFLPLKKIDGNKPVEITVRKESLILDILTSFIMRGFFIEDCSLKREEFYISLRNLTRIATLRRIEEISTFLFPIWYSFQARYIIIHYSSEIIRSKINIHIDTNKYPEVFSFQTDPLKISQYQLKRIISKSKIPN